MDEEDRNHKQRLLAIYQDNLRELEYQAAQFGLIVPLSISNQIKFHRQNIADLRLQLTTNASEVSFDKLLVGIEDLRKSVREEGVRAITEYRKAFVVDRKMMLGILGIFGVNRIVRVALAFLYFKYIKYRMIKDQYNIFPEFIRLSSDLSSLFVLWRLERRLSRKRYREFVERMGYDPFNLPEK